MTFVFITEKAKFSLGCLSCCRYMKRSVELTESVCKKHQVDVAEFQNALLYYHDETLFAVRKYMTEKARLQLRNQRTETAFCLYRKHWHDFRETNRKGIVVFIYFNALVLGVIPHV